MALYSLKASLYSLEFLPFARLILINFQRAWRHSMSNHGYSFLFTALGLRLPLPGGNRWI